MATKLWTGVASDGRGRFIFLTTAGYVPKDRERLYHTPMCDTDAQVQMIALKDLDRLSEWLPELPCFVFALNYPDGVPLIRDSDGIWAIEG
jgi:hypothetical protein